MCLIYIAALVDRSEIGRNAKLLDTRKNNKWPLGIDPSRSLKVLLSTKIMMKSPMVTALEDFYRAPL